MTMCNVGMYGTEQYGHEVLFDYDGVRCDFHGSFKPPYPTLPPTLIVTVDVAILDVEMKE